ncbi:MAG: HAD hydrolase family protein, partial [Desulfobacteraceae bacterium]|nr:HAD hydrolase family protein [Desulfobacteraceae bacterium]
IATGRSVYSFQMALKTIAPWADEQDFPIDYVLVSTGAGILDFPICRLLKSYSLKSSQVVDIAGYFDKNRVDYMVHKSVPNTRHFVYKSHTRSNPDFNKRIELYSQFSEPLNGSLEDFGNATEVLAIIPNGISPGHLDKIKADLNRFSVIHATSPLDHESAWIEVFHKDVSKSLAAGWLAKKLGSGPEYTIAVGNDYNDEDLLQWSKASFVVANAACRLKERYQTVASNNQNGVTQAAKMAGLIE